MLFQQQVILNQHAKIHTESAENSHNLLLSSTQLGY